jgi:divalent metal cation (Fe/Co/Zn/Cd) transporter
MLSGLSLLIASETGAMVRRQLRWLALMTVAVMILIAALSFSLMALYIWLQGRFSPVEASLIIALGLFVLAACLLIAAALVRRAKRDRSPVAATALVMAPTAAKLVARRIDFATLSVAGVIAIGAYIGRKLARG